MSVFGVEYDPSNYMDAAFAPIQAANKRAVMIDTWGHLAPERDVAYLGHIVFAYGDYGDIVPIITDFKELPDSPWFFDDMMEFIGKRVTKRGVIYRFDGKYKNHMFIGVTKRVKL